MVSLMFTCADYPDIRIVAHSQIVITMLSQGYLCKASTVENIRLFLNALLAELSVWVVGMCGVSRACLSRPLRGRWSSQEQVLRQS